MQGYRIWEEESEQTKPCPGLPVHAGAGLPPDGDSGEQGRGREAGGGGAGRAMSPAEQRGRGAGGRREEQDSGRLVYPIPPPVCFPLPGSLAFPKFPIIGILVSSSLLLPTPLPLRYELRPALMEPWQGRGLVQWVSRFSVLEPGAGQSPLVPADPLAIVSTLPLTYGADPCALCPSASEDLGWDGGREQRQVGVFIPLAPSL